MSNNEDIYRTPEEQAAIEDAELQEAENEAFMDGWIARDLLGG